MSNNINTINNKILPKIQLLHQKWMNPADLADSYKRFIESKSQAMYEVYSDITTILSRLSKYDPQELVNDIMESFYPTSDKPQVANGLCILQYQAWNYGNYDVYPTLPQKILEALEGCKFITVDNPFRKWYCPLPVAGDVNGYSTTPFYCIDVIMSSIYLWYFEEYLWDGTNEIYPQPIPTKAPNGVYLSLTIDHLLAFMEDQTLKNQTIISALETITTDRSASDFLLILKASLGNDFDKVSGYAQGIIQTLQNNVDDLYQAINTVLSPAGNTEFTYDADDDTSLRLQVANVSTGDDVVGAYWIGNAKTILESQFSMVVQTTKFVLKSAWSLVKSAVRLVWSATKKVANFVASPPTMEYNEKGDGTFNIFSSNVFSKYLNMHPYSTNYAGWGDSIDGVINDNFGIEVNYLDATKAIFGENFEEMIEIPFTFGSIYLEANPEGVHMCTKLRPTPPSVQNSGFKYSLEFLFDKSPFQSCSLDTQFSRLFDSPVMEKAFTTDDEFYLYEGIQWSRARMEFVLGLITSADLSEAEFETTIPLQYYDRFGYVSTVNDIEIHVGPISPRGWDDGNFNQDSDAMHTLDYVPVSAWDSNNVFYSAIVYNNTMAPVSACLPGTRSYDLNKQAFNIIPHLLAFLFYNTKTGIQMAADQTATTPKFFIPYRQITSLKIPSWVLLSDAAQAQVYNNRMMTLGTIVIVTATAAFALKSIASARNSKIMAVDLASRQYTNIAMRGGDSSAAEKKYADALKEQRRFQMLFGGAIGTSSSAVVSEITSKADINSVIELIR